MAEKLRLYRNIAPNAGRNTHYVFNDAQDYLDEIESERVGAILTLDNYRINNNVAKIEAGQVFKEIMHELTYITIYDDETKYFRGYWVSSSVLQSGYLVLNLRVDLWASAIMGAKFENLHVTRCNREIDGGGYFDAIKTTNNYNNKDYCKLPLETGTGLLPLAQVAVVIKLQYNVSQNLFGGQAITETKLFYCAAKDIYDEIHNINPDYDSVNPIEKITDFVAGIYALETGSVIDNSAQAVRLWLLPLEVVTSETFYASYALSYVKTKCAYTDFQDAFIDILHPCPPLIFSKRFDLATTLSQNLADAWIVRDTLAQNSFIAGTPNNGVHLTRRELPSVEYLYTIQADDVKVIVSEGENAVDISRAFELSITGNNETATLFSRIANAIGNSFTTGASWARAGMSSNASASGAVVKFVDEMGGLLSRIGDARPLSSISSGDGASTFIAFGYSQSLRSPYRFGYRSSVQDEIENANYNGVNFDTFINALSVPPSKRLICSSSWTFDGNQKTFARTSETFLQIDDMKIEGVQEDAKEYIRNEFARGIFYEII